MCFHVIKPKANFLLQKYQFNHLQWNIYVCAKLMTIWMFNWSYITDLQSYSPTAKKGIKKRNFLLSCVAKRYFFCKHPVVLDVTNQNETQPESLRLSLSFKFNILLVRIYWPSVEAGRSCVDVGSWPWMARANKIWFDFY